MRSLFIYTRFTRYTRVLVPVVLLLAACVPVGTVTPTPTEAILTPVPTPAPAPSALTVCIGQEPSSLFPLGNPSASARAVLAALYDGPIDFNSYSHQAVILESLPSVANGDAQVFETAVYVGDEVVDVNGTPVTLAEGVMIRPAGCRTGECAIEYDGQSEVVMDQMTVTFRLVEGLLWSDGMALTAADSVYAYGVAAELGNNYLAVRTQSYEAADERTVQWWGRPGFIEPSYETIFFMPFPEHLWGGIPADELADSEIASLNPTGWGAYAIEEWEAGVAIRMLKNPAYFRAGEGLPKIDVLTFRFTPDPEVALADLLAGECDVLDASVPLDGQVAMLQSLDEQGELQAFFAVPPVMEQLAFGIRPAEYDNGNNPVYDRPDYFGDVRVRQAVAQCIDRQAIIDTVLYGLSPVPVSFVPAEHPLYDAGRQGWGFDPVAANALLEEAGWRDLDGVPSTPRQAWGVAKIDNGTLFEVTYVTTGAAQRVQVSTLVAESLALCGVKVNVELLDAEALYASGPEGVLFGRGFEMAAFAMGSAGFEPPCDWFTSDEIPGTGNGWVGTNLSGYGNADFDEACDTARQSLPDEVAFLQAYQQAQFWFVEEVPVLPLYWRVKSAAAGMGVCGFELDATAASGLWNIESMAVGADCAP